MIEIIIQHDELLNAANQGNDAFLDLVVNKTREAIGGELSAQNMQEMSPSQITLIGYATLRDELMDGGFVQLIHNGYGSFYFRNPFDMAVRLWGLIDLCKLMRKAKKLYMKHREAIEKNMNDEEFMALYEQMPDFEDLDDSFVTNEEEWSNMVAYYIDEHMEEFGIKIIK